MGSSVGEILLILFLVLLNGYFAAAEIALISARQSALKRRAEEGSRGAQTALTLTDDPTRLLATIQIGITLVGFLASATAAVSLAQPVQAWFESWGVSWLTPAAAGLAVFFVTLAISYVTLVFGELVPKRIGLQRAESVAIAVSGSINFLERLLAPLVWLLAVSTNLVSRPFGVAGEGGRPGVSEEEIKLLVTEQGTLLEAEKKMIHEIFELGDTVAREIMVPRVDMALVEDSDTADEAVAVMKESGYSRLPVYHEDRDRIAGVVMLRDLVGPGCEARGDEPVTAFMREPVFVPETKSILPLLSEMQARHAQMVIVVDEYGGTAGLVTVEDIVEEVVGEIADEFDRDRRYITEIAPGEWVLDGRLPIEDATGLSLPVEESDEYDTIAGWLLTKLGHIPVPGETFETDGCSFRVQAVRRRRIARIRVSCQQEQASPEGAVDDSG
jgi:putative hemolysin